jgi:hypothetical protein
VIADDSVGVSLLISTRFIRVFDDDEDVAEDVIDVVDVAVASTV